MHIAHYLGLLHRSEQALAEAYRQVARDHADEPDIEHLCTTLAKQCDEHADRLKPFDDRYAEEATDEQEQLYSELFSGTRTGGLGLLRDLHDLYLMVNGCDICWTVLGQAAKGLRDQELIEVVGQCEGQTRTQLQWARTRMKQAAPQALVVAA